MNATMLVMTEKKSTKIDIAPQELRDTTVAAMLMAGFSVDATRRMVDGTYDLEYLQLCHEQAIGFCRGVVTLAIEACAAWARVYSVGLRLVGGAELYEPREAVTILPPTGAPFSTVGTKETQEAVDFFVSYAIDADTEQGATSTLADFPQGERLRDLIAHRDHLHAQVTEVQAANTDLQSANRMLLARNAGMVARMAGSPRDVNPYNADEHAHGAFNGGWAEVDAFANSVVETVREVDKYAPRKP